MEEMGFEGSLEKCRWGEKKEKVARLGACEELDLNQWRFP